MTDDKDDTDAYSIDADNDDDCDDQSWLSKMALMFI